MNKHETNTERAEVGVQNCTPRIEKSRNSNFLRGCAMTITSLGEENRRRGLPSGNVTFRNFPFSASSNSNEGVLPLESSI